MEKHLRSGMWLGLLAVASFSLTLPATRVAVATMHPLFVSSGRAVVAALLAAIYLYLGRHRLPTRSEFKRLAIVAAGVVIGFPVCTAWAMQRVDSSHGGVMLGILPLVTAAAGAIVSRERPSAKFWFFAGLGSALVIGFSLLSGAGRLQLADIALLVAVLSAAIGYAVGARLALTLGGLETISWALILCAPLVLFPTVYFFPPLWEPPWQAWAALAYVSVISQYLGFWPWYRGLALGGTARVGQLQLLQPFMTLVAAAVLLGETIRPITLAFALAVFAVVSFGSKARIAHGESGGRERRA